MTFDSEQQKQEFLAALVGLPHLAAAALAGKVVPPWIPEHQPKEHQP